MKKFGVLIIAVFILTGCTKQINLTSQESETIANYAAYVTLQYDKKYDKKLESTDLNAIQNPDDLALATSSSTVSSDPQNIEGTSEETLTQEITPQDTVSEEVQTMDIASMLNLEGFQITYEGVEYTKQYQDEEQTNGYVANSLDNNEFLVLKFKVENMTDETKVCDVLSVSPRLKVSINGEDAINTYGSLLNNDMSTLFDEIDAHAAKDVVLLVEVPQEYDNNVSTISLEIGINGQNSSIELQ